MPLAAVILAAGHSRRMGQPKLLLPWGGKTILHHLASLWEILGAKPVIVVHRPDDLPLIHELARLGVDRALPLPNSRPDASMFDSISIAASWTGWSEMKKNQVALVLGDQPHLGEKILRGFVTEAMKEPHFIWQPARNGTGRHPVILPLSVLLSLPSSHLPTLKHFLLQEQARVRFFPVEDPAFDLDLDRPEDYELARRLYLE